MSEQDKVIAESKSAEAVNAATTAAEALENARVAQLAAAKAETTEALIDALNEVFGEHTSSGRFIDVTRIPLICKSIIDMNTGIQEIKESLKTAKRDLDEKDEANAKKFVNQDQFAPVQKVVYGLVALILSTVVLAILGLVIISAHG